MNGKCDLYSLFQRIVSKLSLPTKRAFMKSVTCYLVLFFGMLACSGPTPDPAFKGEASALLNEQAWGGIIQTWRGNASAGACASNTVNLNIQNKLPYPKARLLAPDDCAGYCGDQSLVFTSIPLSVGSYPLSRPQPCSAGTDQVGVSFTTLIGGDVIRDHYQPDSTKTGTITITRYNPQKGDIEGTFNITLVRSTNRQTTTDAAAVVVFRNGVFKAKLP